LGKTALRREAPWSRIEPRGHSLDDGGPFFPKNRVGAKVHGGCRFSQKVKTGKAKRNEKQDVLS